MQIIQSVKLPEIDDLHRQCGSPEFVAEAVRGFRRRLNINVKEAGYLLGVPARTLEGVEQGREFPYPALLVKFINFVIASLPAEEVPSDGEA